MDEYYEDYLEERLERMITSGIEEINAHNEDLMEKIDSEEISNPDVFLEMNTEDAERIVSGTRDKWQKKCEDMRQDRSSGKHIDEELIHMKYCQDEVKLETKIGLASVGLSFSKIGDLGQEIDDLINCLNESDNEEEDYGEENGYYED